MRLNLTQEARKRNRRTKNVQPAMIFVLISITIIYVICSITFFELSIGKFQHIGKGPSHHGPHILEKGGAELNVKKKLDGFDSNGASLKSNSRDQNHPSNDAIETYSDNREVQVKKTLDKSQNDDLRGMANKGDSESVIRWKFDPERIIKVQQLLLQKTQRLSPVLTAYVEESLPPNQGSPQNSSNFQQPLRTQSPGDLKKYRYDQVSKCSEMPTKFPVNHPIELNDEYKNVDNENPMYKIKFQYAKYCPVDADPYLPWIFDVFPSMNLETSKVEYVEILAQNKRRCNTGIKKHESDTEERFTGDLENLKHQVAIMQPVPIKRISSHDAITLAPELWSHSRSSYNGSSFELVLDGRATASRYRLATYEDADQDSKETRFICRYHTFDFSDDSESTIRNIILGETLSVFPYNYEYVNWRKHTYSMLSAGGPGANNDFWNSLQHFRCPIPSHLQDLIGREKSVINDVAAIYLDVVPIRTRVRLLGGEYFTEEMVGDYYNETTFDPTKEWGSAHVIPEVEASGRWENIPLCTSPMPARSPNDVQITEDLVAIAASTSGNKEAANKQYTLIGCLWASAEFTARGNSPIDSSTSSRLFEWLTYHLYVANMDHIYVYDNSGAHSDEVSLMNVTSFFPRDRVTRINWPFRVCNNNNPANWNTGERSSQYAAEASCRLRFGPFTEFLASFDTDEYLTPMGNWMDLKGWLTEGVTLDTNVLSFYSAKASPNYEYMQPYWDGGECGADEADAKCVIQRPDALYLETYNCEVNPLPKPDWGKRAKKQIYRPSYVLNHYVHYSTVTQETVILRSDAMKRNFDWSRKDKPPSERRVDDLEEATMMHTKSTLPQGTREYKQKCHNDYNPKSEYDKCRVGFAHPLWWKDGDIDFRSSDGYKYNCYMNPRLVDVFLPKLRNALDQFQHQQEIINSL